MPTTTWNQTTIDGEEFLVISVAEFRIPLDWDPSSTMFIAVAAPTGGLGSFPALVQGDPGDAPTLDNVTFTVLEADDPTPDSADWTETSPGVYDLELALHKGPQGDPGDTILTPSDYGDATVGKTLVVNEDEDGFELQTQKVGDRYVPASFNSIAAGNVTATLCSVSVPAQDFDWRPHVEGGTIIDGTSTNVRVDLYARLDAGGGGTPEASGNIVARSFGIASANKQMQVLMAGPPASASATYDKVEAGVEAVVYFRAERIAGTGTFTTTSDTTWFGVRVCPIP